MRRRVVFPQPDGPRRVRNSPALTLRQTSSTAVSEAKRLVMWFSWITSADGERSGESNAAQRRVRAAANVAASRITEAPAGSGTGMGDP